jgi:wobble nucleotide-excising tRNase
MISRIVMDQVACFREATHLVTDKRVNLLYGLNGTGKSTISDFLYDPDVARYASCRLESDDDDDIFVYNRSFINDFFYESSDLPGVFTLSKENTDAERRIEASEQIISDLRTKLSDTTQTLENLDARLEARRDRAVDAVWQIKTRYSGGDRVLEYCLTGLMGRKEALFSHLLSIEKPSEEPHDSVESLKTEVESLRENEGSPVKLLQPVEYDGSAIETDSIFEEPIIGNKENELYQLIDKLQNSDWVRRGMDYLPDQIMHDPERCPFCQEQSITEDLLSNLRGYFDDSYQQRIEQLKSLMTEYEDASLIALAEAEVDSHPFLTDKRAEFDSLIQAVRSCIETNVAHMKSKLDSPSTTARLESSIESVRLFNEFVKELNSEIAAYNEKLLNIDDALDEIKTKFWLSMRCEFDQTVSDYEIERASIQAERRKLQNSVTDIKDLIQTESDAIDAERLKTVNIDEAIGTINRGLLELGIDGFWIEKHSEDRYRIVRVEPSENTFETLSEGEKMIISFLYFRETVKGRRKPDDQQRRRVVVIDDPVSSLSHIYVFNVAQMIRSDFCNSSVCDQVFVLTHSLYFFYELTDRRSRERAENQQLFRLTKHSQSSVLVEMPYEEIQNDYQSYWSAIKNRSLSPALVANCMRNIVEYFFGFVEDKNLNELFQKEPLRSTKYQAFCRFINRESHSDAKNIFDIKEFDYDVFREGLRLVFSETGYESHYEAMMR